MNIQYGVYVRYRYYCRRYHDIKERYDVEQKDK